ncbi:MAG: hypothetical protein SNI45_07605 [Rikenellaceae bacterium]
MKRQNYETPQVEVIEIKLEGIICASGETSLSDVNDDGSAW